MDHFAHLNKECVKQEFDVALKRCVIVVKSQRAPLHMVHVFSNVLPGRYTVQFRLRLPDSRLAFLYRNSNGDTPTPVKILGKAFIKQDIRDFFQIFLIFEACQDQNIFWRFSLLELPGNNSC